MQNILWYQVSALTLIHNNIPLEHNPSPNPPFQLAKVQTLSGKDVVVSLVGILSQVSADRFHISLRWDWFHFILNS